MHDADSLPPAWSAATAATTANSAHSGASAASESPTSRSLSPATAGRSTRDRCEIDLAGEPVALLAARALFWARESIVVIADPHFGKAAAFRAHGIPVPHGTTATTLERLSATLAATQARRLVILGDFLHHRTGRSTSTLAALTAWRMRHAALEIDLVLGNHDAHAGAPPADLAIRTHATAVDCGPFRFAHEPAVARGRHVLAGHVHPACVVSGRRESVRLACFLAGADTTVLPAFGTFTGTCVVRPGPTDRAFVIADDAIFALPR